MGADPDIHPFRDRLQVLLQPGPLIGVQADPVVPAAGEARVGGRPVEGVVEVDDVVEHDPVVLADVHRIIGRTHRVAVGPLGVVIDIGREGGRDGGPVVVVVAHHAVQGAGIAAGAQVVTGFGDVPVEAVPDLVMGEVAEVEQDDRPVGGAAGMDPFHVREGVGFEEPLVPEHGVVLDVDVGGKKDRIAGLVLRNQLEIMRLCDAGGLCQRAVEIRKEPVLERDRVPGGGADEHEALALVALQGIAAVGIGPDDGDAVGDADALDGTALGGDAPGDVLGPCGQGQSGEEKCGYNAVDHGSI